MLTSNNLIDGEVFEKILHEFGEFMSLELSRNKTLTGNMAIMLVRYIFDKKIKDKTDIVNNLIIIQKDNEEIIVKLIPYIYKLEDHRNKMKCIGLVFTRTALTEKTIYTLVESAKEPLMSKIIINNILGEKIVSPSGLLKIIDKFDNQKTHKREIDYIEEYAERFRGEEE